MEMPGSDPQSLEIAAQGIAETVAELVRGGADIPMAMEIAGKRSAVFEQVHGRVLELVMQLLSDYPIPTVDLVRKPGISVNEALDPEVINEGDLVAFGDQNKYYVTDINYHPSYFWVTPRRSERFNCECKGMAVYKKYATQILERAEKPEE